MAGSSLSAPHPTIANLRPVLTDSANSNLILLATMTGTVDATANTYQAGCILLVTDVAAATQKILQNTGTSAAPVWSPFGVPTLPAVNFVSSNSNGTNGAICASLFTTGTTKAVVTSGTRVLIKLNHTLTKNTTNTLNLNGTTKNIVSHKNTSNNIGSSYSVNGMIEVVYTPGVGSGVFQDLSS